MKKPLSRRALEMAPSGAERLGLPTIMDRALAAEHGVDYVHLAAFAIDIDRIRVASEEAGDEELPFGWEVFLTECYLLESLDATTEGAVRLIEDLCLSIFELREGEEVLGTQVPFAVWHAVERRGWPVELKRALKTWKSRPEQLGKDLDGFFDDEIPVRGTLARICLAADLKPPIAPPTLEVLERWAAIHVQIR